MAATKLFGETPPRDSIALTVLLILCHTAESEPKESLQVCVFDKYVGRREGGYCYVDMAKQDRRSSLQKAAENCLSSNGSIVNDSEATALDLSHVRRNRELDGEFLEDLSLPDEECVNSPDSCNVLCKLPVCPSGFFAPPICSKVCLCKQTDFCDSLTGDCLNEDCYSGFYQPPLCLKQCNCLGDVACDSRTGRCHLGCKPGWTGEDCRTRLCPVGRALPPACLLECHCYDKTDCNALEGTCEHGCASGWSGKTCSEKCVGGVCLQGCFCSNRSCEDPPGKCLCDIGWSGKYCSESNCPFGTYGPPSCSGTCFCENDRFCNPSNGDCMGTPCEGNRKGSDCQGTGCPPGYFNPPKCEYPCYCAKGTTCDIHTGTCKSGCEAGWYGRFCNERLCEDGKFHLPSCDRRCHCRVPAACNSLNGKCERSSCALGWTGFYCNLTATERRVMAGYRFHSSPSYIMAPLAIIIVVVTALMAMSMWSNRMPRLDETSLQRDQEIVEI